MLRWTEAELSASRKSERNCKHLPTCDPRNDASVSGDRNGAVPALPLPSRELKMALRGPSDRLLERITFRESRCFAGAKRNCWPRRKSERNCKHLPSRDSKGTAYFQGSGALMASAASPELATLGKPARQS